MQVPALRAAPAAVVRAAWAPSEAGRPLLPQSQRGSLRHLSCRPASLLATACCCCCCRLSHPSSGQAALRRRCSLRCACGCCCRCCRRRHSTDEQPARHIVQPQQTHLLSSPSAGGFSTTAAARNPQIGAACNTEHDAAALPTSNSCVGALHMLLFTCWAVWDWVPVELLPDCAAAPGLLWGLCCTTQFSACTTCTPSRITGLRHC